MSNILSINGTYDTPEILFDPNKGIFKISGRSLPSNSYDFYKHLIDTLHKYFENPQPESEFEFKMDFISSSTTKIFQDLMVEIDEVYKKGFSVNVKWYYKFADDDMKELGDELRYDLSFPFEFVMYS